MKKFSKILSVALLVALVLSLGVASAFAAPATTTLNIDPAVDGHTYTGYQLFVGDLAADGKTLSNVKWGANALTNAISYTVENAQGETETKSVTPAPGEAVPADFLEYVASLSTSTEKSIADTIGSWVGGTGFAVTATETEVVTGYYVVKDAYTSPTNPQETTLSTTMVNIVGPTTMAPKAGTTEHKKEVADVNDSTEVALDLTDLTNIDASKWDDSADYDFEDHIPFKLTTTIASDFAKYDEYYLAVNDTLYDGLVLDQDSIKVYVDGQLATAGTEAGEYSLTKAEKSFKVEFTKLNGNTNAAAGKDVVVYYTAKLDKDTAVIGNAGNWNESWATFSNNPNGNQEGTTDTPKDTAVVFTFKTDVNKINKDKDPLKGAEFTLTKKIKDSDTPVEIAVIKYDKDGNVTTKSANGTATSEGDATKFSFQGLDDGIYTLTETVTPNGYNTIEPVTFVIYAEHENAGKTVGQIKTLTVKNEDGSAFDGTLVFTPDTAAGSLTTDVVNQSGTVLPSTGGIGTTIFYVVGGVLVLAAIILLVTKKRMSE